ncbi:MAG: hypothetical protein L0211_07720 [Planctomycetaceae bacterium]|nr:hypothetical protein [Planctomycetaceae bacterium]
MRILVYCGSWLLVAGVASGQQPVAPVGQLPATTVQLPSFSIFSVNTTVSVPDRGGAYLGGVSRARDSSTTRGFGPLRNRGIGAERAAGGMAVQATIHNLDELDRATLVRATLVRATLAEAAARRGSVDPDLAKAELIRRGVGRGIADGQDIAAAGAMPAPPADSVAAIRAKNAAAAQARASEADELFAKAEAAEAAGKASVAKIYYQMAARRDTGAIKALAESRLAKLSEKPVTVAKR